MTLLPSQVQAPRSRIEMAFGAQIATPLGWVWVDVTDRLLSQSISIRRGRDDEQANTQPASVGFELDNPDGHLTPHHPGSPWWPNVKRGTPCRIWVPGRTPALVVPGANGANATTPDHPNLAITGPITVLARVQPDNWGFGPSGTSQRLVTKWLSPANEEWMFYTFGAGRLGWEWTTDGATDGIATFRSTQVLAGTLRPFGVGVEFHPDNGDGGNTTRFLTSFDGTSWEVVDEVVVPGTTSIFNGTASVEVATRNGGIPSFRGRVIAAQVIDGDVATGTPVANPDFTTLTPGTTSFTDAAGRLWQVNGTARVTTEQIRFVGQVGEMRPDWPYGDLSDPANPDEFPGEARVAITAAGFLRRLGQGAKPLQSTLRRLVGAPQNQAAVIGYWPLEDGADSTVGASAVPGQPPMRFSSTVRFAADSSFPASAPLPSLSGGVDGRWAVRLNPETGTQWLVDWFLYIPTPHTAPEGFSTMAVQTSGRASLWTFGINDTVVSVAARDGDGTVLVSTTFPSDPRFFDAWVLWTFRLEQDGPNVDWSLNLTPIPGGLTFGVNGTVAAANVGSITALSRVGGPAPPDGVSFGHFIVTTDRGLGWLAGGDTAWIEETAAHRFFRLCNEESIPSVIVGDTSVGQFFRGNPEQSTQMGPQRQLTLPELLQECVDVDIGAMGDLRTGPGLWFRTRRSLYNQPAAVSLDAATNDITPPGVTPFEDDQRLRNDITVTRQDGSSARATDQPSIDADGLYDEDVTLNLYLDDQVADQAAWRVHLGTWPGMRYPAVVSELTVAPHQIDPWLDLTIGDRLTVGNLPPQHPADVVDLIAEATVETLTPARWTIEARCSPAEPWTVGVLDDGTGDAGSGRLRSDGSQLSTGVDADDTAFTVAVTAGPRWTTAPAQFPLRATLGGEEVEVTAIAGASSPQTWTVTRAANGITKAHPAGTPINVADPFRLSL